MLENQALLLLLLQRNKNIIEICIKRIILRTSCKTCLQIVFFKIIDWGRVKCTL